MMTADATTLMDLVRVAYGEPETFRSHRIDVKGSSRMTYVRSRPVPRVRTRARARVAVRRVLLTIASDPSSELARRLIGASSWFSTSITRWPENPRFATAMLWMALEALFGGCVIRHRKCHHRRQLTASIFSLVTCYPVSQTSWKTICCECAGQNPIGRRGFETRRIGAAVGSVVVLRILNLGSRTFLAEFRTRIRESRSWCGTATNCSDSTNMISQLRVWTQSAGYGV